VRRLYVQLWLWFVLVGVVAFGAAGVSSWVATGFRPSFADVYAASVVGVQGLQPSAPGFRKDAERLARELDAELTLFTPEGEVAWSVGRPMSYGPPGPFRERGTLGVRVQLADGRSFGLRRSDGRARFVAFWGGVLAVFAVGAWPLARRLTRRLEALEATAARWGAGDLSARAPVAGRDEVAALARTFNGAADRVEALVSAHRRVLASASHELRSPLARLRLALELLDEERDHPLLAGAVRDVEILDETVADLLQAGRLQAMDTLAESEEVDLRALLVEEAARVDAAVDGRPALVVRGSPGLLRSLARNLLENARRHGAPPIRVDVGAEGFAVVDAGPGVPDAEKERIFEPFYRPAGHDEGRDGGVGLGLHLCAQIARLHGGSLRCADAPGGGTRFEVALAAAGAPRVAP
jgi:signal transduction histidine kinase